MVRSADVSRTAPKTDRQSALVQGKQNQRADELVVMSKVCKKSNGNLLQTI